VTKQLMSCNTPLAIAQSAMPKDQKACGNNKPKPVFYVKYLNSICCDMVNSFDIVIISKRKPLQSSFHLFDQMIDGGYTPF